MKNLMMITMVVFTLQATAQRPNWVQQENMMGQKMSFMEDFSPEQIANLKTKRMVLQLDLTADQTDKVNNLNLVFSKAFKENMEEMKEKKGKGKPSSENRYLMMIGKLNDRIAYRDNLKEILNKEQLEKWEEMMKNKFANRSQFMQNRANKYGRG